MYDTEIEKAILYYIIFENYECDIQESDFVDAKTLCIAKSIIRLKQDKKEITMLSVTNHIKKGNNSNVIDYITNKLDNAKSIDINDYLYMYSKKIKDIAKPYHLCRNTNY